MSQLNILFGIFYTEQNEGIVGALCSTLINEMTECGAQVGCVDFAKSRMQIESGLASEKYNVLICKEQLGDESIGAETLQSMEQKFPGVAIMLVVSNDRKGGDELVKLCMNSAGYYNALFESDFTGENIFSVINSPRTREEALEYYGIAKHHEVETVDSIDKELGGFDFSGMFSSVQEEVKITENETFPDKAKVIRVFDYNTMLLQFDKAPILPQGRSLEDYFLLCVVKGTQGDFVQGRYRIGLKSFDGYFGRRIRPKTFIMEVPEYNLLDNDIEGSECSVVFMDLVDEN